MVFWGLNERSHFMAHSFTIWRSLLSCSVALISLLSIVMQRDVSSAISFLIGCMISVMSLIWMRKSKGLNMEPYGTLLQFRHSQKKTFLLWRLFVICDANNWLTSLAMDLWCQVHFSLWSRPYSLNSFRQVTKYNSDIILLFTIFEEGVIQM